MGVLLTPLADFEPDLLPPFAEAGLLLRGDSGRLSRGVKRPVAANADGIQVYRWPPKAVWLRDGSALLEQQRNKARNKIPLFGAPVSNGTRSYMVSRSTLNHY